MGYEIRFWREVTNSHGHPFRVVLARFAVDHGRPGKGEVAEATELFCRMMHVNRWGIVAHGYDIADTDAAPANEAERRDAGVGEDFNVGFAVREGSDATVVWYSRSRSFIVAMRACSASSSISFITASRFRPAA